MPVGRYWMHRAGPGTSADADRDPLRRADPARRAASTAAEVMERVRLFFEQSGADDATPAERSRELAGATAP